MKSGLNRTLGLLGGALAATGAAVMVILTWSSPSRAYVRAYDHVMGTSLDLTLLATSEEAADRATAAVLAEIDRASALLSGYDSASEFNRWAATKGTAEQVSIELFDVLQRFDFWRARTGGALDPSAEVVSRVWKTAAGAGRMPTTDALTQAVAAVRQPHWQLDLVRRTATHLSSTPLALNSFTKSYIIDRAAGAGLKTPGVDAVVVNSGGDLVTRGSWSQTVNVTDPQSPFENALPLTRLAIRDRAVATSGGYRRGFDINGVHYSHIVDPRTGRPAGHVLSATVVARDAADAGALATAFCVLTPEESEQLARLVPGAEFLLVLADGRLIRSDGWNDLKATVRPPRQVAPVATLYAAEQGTWNTDFALTISFEIGVQTRRAQRPYLAVWIENKDRAPVRTLAVWYRADHSRWLADLRSWIRSDRVRSQTQGTEILGSVSSATRGPGAYTLAWDGRDNTGTLVKAGTYTVNIEVAREHGTYQLMRQEMDFSGVAKHIALLGNVEISAATLDYHRVVTK